MGVMRFLVHPPDLLQSWPEAAEALISGFDGRTFPTRVDIEGSVLACRRPLSDSGKLSVPWPIAGRGRPVLTTTSLRERETPYFLPLELARGKLSEVRDQSASWEMAKMAIPDAFRQLQKEAFQSFARAVATQSDLAASAESAQTSIAQACRAADVLLDAYILQRMANIHRSPHHAPSLLGCTPDETVLTEPGGDLFRETFNTAAVPIRWRDIEPREGEYHWELVDRLVGFCTRERMIIRGGPLIDLGPRGLPDWLSPWKDDFLNLPSFVCDFIDTAVSRYTGLIRIWELSANGNTGGALEFSEEHRLAMVARTLEAAVRTNSDAQFFIRIEQPWGEYQRHGQHRLSPFQFVDALVRSNLGLSGISLDLNVGFDNRACLTYEMHSISKLIDFWSLLGLQIHANLAAPSSTAPDALADPEVGINDGTWRETWSEEAQADWVEQVVSLLMAKPTVTGVFIDHFSDALPHRFPNAGLVTAAGRAKRMLAPLRRQLNDGDPA